MGTETPDDAAMELDHITGRDVVLSIRHWHQARRSVTIKSAFLIFEHSNAFDCDSIWTSTSHRLNARTYDHFIVYNLADTKHRSAETLPIDFERQSWSSEMFWRNSCSRKRASEKRAGRSNAVKSLVACSHRDDYVTRRQSYFRLLSPFGGG